MHKRLCACGCGDRVTRKVESQHMNVNAPALLASQVLEQNATLIRRKKRSKAIGFPAPSRRRLIMRNTIENEDMDIDQDDNDPGMVMGADLDESYGQSKSCCSAPNNYYI
jgi:hypothetical protein